uniref:Uncharacterized protein n=1 Tax=Nelumbo nucifera TaxID=4432 RepID=A0A822ZM08_NELNU|nr:TPA_asm: hypothetical protein HUJ06_004023 [Nelumbo nucifera]
MCSKGTAVISQPFDIKYILFSWVSQMGQTAPSIVSLFFFSVVFVLYSCRGIFFFFYILFGYPNKIIIKGAASLDFWTCEEFFPFYG